MYTTVQFLSLKIIYLFFNRVTGNANIIRGVMITLCVLTSRKLTSCKKLDVGAALESVCTGEKTLPLVRENQPHKLGEHPRIHSKDFFCEYLCFEHFRLRIRRMSIVNALSFLFRIVKMDPWLLLLHNIQKIDISFVTVVMQKLLALFQSALFVLVCETAWHPSWIIL